jgi:hypothetical protein
VLQCHGRDITIKNSKTKRNILLVLPIHYKFHGKSTYDVKIGSLTKTSSRNPEFVVHTNDHTLIFVGKYVAIQSKLFTMDCQMTKKQQNLMAEFYDKALVFTAENVTRVPRVIESGEVVAGAAPVPDHDSVDLTGGSQNDIQLTSSSQDSVVKYSESEYITQFGCSREAELSCSKGGLLSRSISRTGSIPSSQMDTSIDLDDSPTVASAHTSVQRTNSRGSMRASASKIVSYVEGSDDDFDDLEDDLETFEHSYKDDSFYFGEARLASVSANANANANGPAESKSGRGAAAKAKATSSTPRKRKIDADESGTSSVKTTPASKAVKAQKDKTSSTKTSATKKSTTSSAKKAVAAKTTVRDTGSDSEDVSTDVGSDDEAWEGIPRSQSKNKATKVKTQAKAHSPVRSSSTSVSTTVPRRASRGNVKCAQQVIDLDSSSEDDNDDDDDDDDFEFK